jgi:hypothetical protein
LAHLLVACALFLSTPLHAHTHPHTHRHTAAHALYALTHSHSRPIRSHLEPHLPIRQESVLACFGQQSTPESIEPLVPTPDQLDVAPAESVQRTTLLFRFLSLLYSSASLRAASSSLGSIFLNYTLGYKTIGIAIKTLFYTYSFASQLSSSDIGYYSCLTLALPSSLPNCYRRCVPPANEAISYLIEIAWAAS